MINKKIEMYDTQEEVIDRITNLRNNGLKDTDMYVLANGLEKIDKLQGITDTIGTSEGEAKQENSLWDKFRSFLAGDDSYDETFSIMGVDEDDKDYYLEQLEEGKILLYIDRIFEEGYK